MRKAGLLATVAVTVAGGRGLALAPPAVHYARTPGVAFYPVLSSQPYSTAAFTYLRAPASPGSTVFLAPVQLPSGAKVISLRFEFSDTDPAKALYASLITCDSADTCVGYPSAGAGPSDCLGAAEDKDAICSGIAFASGRSSQDADLTSEEITVDNLDRSYFVRIDASDGGHQIAGVVVGYVLQVSPADSGATFNDVPPSHPFFQFVEALAASGITAGCGAGNYCPDSPVTRGQMAAFLSKALGLYWPN